jgi:hypothetical protein
MSGDAPSETKPDAREDRRKSIWMSTWLCCAKSRSTVEKSSTRQRTDVLTSLEHPSTMSTKLAKQLEIKATIAHLLIFSKPAPVETDMVPDTTTLLMKTGEKVVRRTDL